MKSHLLLIFSASILFLSLTVSAVDVMEIVMPEDASNYLEFPRHNLRWTDNLPFARRLYFTSSPDTLSLKSMEMKQYNGYSFDVELMAPFGSRNHVVMLPRQLPLDISLVHHDERQFFATLKCNDPLDMNSLHILDAGNTSFSQPPSQRIGLLVCPESGIRGFFDRNERLIRMYKQTNSFQFFLTAADGSGLVFETSWMFMSARPKNRLLRGFSAERYRLTLINLPLSRNQRRLEVRVGDRDASHSSAKDYDVHSVDQETIANDDEEVCAICLDDFNDGAAKLATCSHLFHRECLNKWLDSKPRSTGACPTCKQG